MCRAPLQAGHPVTTIAGDGFTSGYRSPGQSPDQVREGDDLGEKIDEFATDVAGGLTVIANLWEF
jgi:hypothetical protein